VRNATSIVADESVPSDPAIVIQLVAIVPGASGNLWTTLLPVDDGMTAVGGHCYSSRS
jgi:hypothetical protein